MTEILQKDICGNSVAVLPDGSKKSVAVRETPKRQYRDISLADGILEQNAEADAMLIHRILQRKLMYSGIDDDQRSRFLHIVINEMMIKTGEMDAASATRDSLLKNCVRNSTSVDF